MSIVVNGRFLRRPPTGLPRVARAHLVHGRRHGLVFETLVPPGIDDPLADRTVWAPPGRAGDHLWEQVVLPAAGRRRRILSLANTAPVAARHGVVMVHDLATIIGPAWFRSELRLYGRISLAAARRADTVLTVSQQVADELAGIGIATDRLHVVRSAVDPAFIPSAPGEVEDTRRRLGLGPRWILHVGWSDPRKDAATLLAASDRIVARVPHDLVLVGGAHRNFAPVDLPERPHVRRPGFVSDEDLRHLMSGAAAFAFPSRYEGFGLPPLEAMACGAPVIVSDLPALRESTGGGATYVPPGDVDGWACALEAALLGQLGAAPPPAWTWEDAARQLREALGA
jgi:glycosyltransferase involved in cell wall biosynthesis